MNAPRVRMVRLLDRVPGERPIEERKVGEFVIVSGIPAPDKRDRTRGITAAIAALEVGESFEHTIPASPQILNIRKRKQGSDFVTRKQPSGRWRIWRIA